MENKTAIMAATWTRAPHPPLRGSSPCKAGLFLVIVTPSAAMDGRKESPASQGGRTPKADGGFYIHNR